METESNPRTEQIAFLSHQLQGIRDRLLLKITPPRSSLYTRHGKRNTRELCVQTASKKKQKTKQNLWLTESVHGQLSWFVTFGLIEEAKHGLNTSTVTEGVKLV